MAESGFFAFFIVSGVGVLIALGYGAFVLSSARRDAVLARYPLQVVSWLIATPFFGLSAFGMLVGWSALISGDSDGIWVFGAVTTVLAALCVLAVVMCSRAARGKCASGPITPAILGFTLPLLVGIPMGFVGVVSFTLLIALLISAGAGVNGLLAIEINKRRRAGLLSANPNATFPSPAPAPASLVAPGVVTPDSHESIVLPPPPPQPEGDSKPSA